MTEDTPYDFREELTLPCFNAFNINGGRFILIYIEIRVPFVAFRLDGGGWPLYLNVGIEFTCGAT